eukprot:452221-Pelagomonas_calceolata.AAC.4
MGLSSPGGSCRSSGMQDVGRGMGAAAAATAAARGGGPALHSSVQVRTATAVAAVGVVWARGAANGRRYRRLRLAEGRSGTVKGRAMGLHGCSTALNSTDEGSSNLQPLVHLHKTLFVLLLLPYFAIWVLSGAN